MAVVFGLTGCSASHHPVAKRPVVPSLKVKYLFLVSARTGKPLRDVSYLPASAEVTDGRGGWFVGLWAAATKNSWGGGTPIVRSGIVHMRHDGSLDRQWGTPQSRSIAVCRLERAGSRLYTLSPGPGSTYSSRVAVQAFDAATGRLLWTVPVTPHNRSGACPTYAFAASSKRVYLAGDFSAVRGALRSSAALDAQTGGLLDWRIPRLRYFMMRGYVTALATAGARLYVAGVFSSVGGQPRHALAALNARTGSLLPWKARLGDQRIDTIFVNGHDVYVSGRDGFWAFDAGSGQPTNPGWSTRMNGLPAAFAREGALLYLGGSPPAAIDSVGGQRRNNLASFNVVTGQFTNWAPNLAPYVSVGRIVPSGDAVLIGCGCENTIG